MEEWKILEHTVKALEQSINLESHVETNVELPVLNSPLGRTRQCDVVITHGKPPRISTTIVEVQERGKPVELNTFQGWLGKMNEVGAQQLICVSRHNFPDSIREIASMQGNTVHLMVLTNDSKLIPDDFIKPDFTVTRPVVEDCENVFLDTLIDLPVTEQEITYLDKIFILNDSHDYLSFIELINILIREVFLVNGESPTRLKFNSTPEKKLQVLWNKKILDLRSIETTIHYVYQSMNIPVEILSYNQIGSITLGWALNARLNIDNISIPIVVTVKKRNDGMYEISSVNFHGNDIPLLGYSILCQKPKMEL